MTAGIRVLYIGPGSDIAILLFANYKISNV